MLRISMFPDHCLILADHSELDRAVASKLLELVEKAIAERGACSLALAGGRTPRGAYRLLGQDAFRRQIAWDRVELFWSDERSVPPEHPDSNYRMALESLVAHLDMRPEAIHRILGEAEPDTAASLYAKELRRCLGRPIPRIDVILLGIGSDGHTASLFPDTENLLDEVKLAVATKSPTSPRDRVSLTLRTINAARHVMFVVAGSDKASVLAQILQAPGDKGDQVLPAGLVQPTDGTLMWMLDRDAAAKLESQSNPHLPTHDPD
jgi:6-phosphogluconolactonase